MTVAKKSRKQKYYNKKTKKNIKKSNNIKKKYRKYNTLKGGSGQDIRQSQNFATATLGTTGSNGSSNTKFNSPHGITISADNRIYIADSKNHRVQIFDGLTRNYIATLGTGIAGSSNKKFNYPIDVAVSSDNRIYVVDQNNHRVQVFHGASKNYKFITTLGTTGSTGTSNKHFNSPSSVAISSDNHIYVADCFNHRIQVFGGAIKNYKYIATMGTGSKGDSNTQFNCPIDVAVSKNNLIYVADRDNHRIQVFDGASRTYKNTLVTSETPDMKNTKLFSPSNVTVSDSDNRIYVVDRHNNRVYVYYSATLNFITTLCDGSSGSSNKQLKNPQGIAISETDHLVYIVDTGNHRVQIFISPPAQYITLIPSNRHDQNSTNNLNNRSTNIT
jgi:tripartite motif-containing protein 71